MNKPLSQLIEELRVLHGKTTQERWQFDENEEEIVSLNDTEMPEESIFNTQFVTTTEEETRANALFTAAIHNHFPAIVEALRWIPVEERLPELEIVSEGYSFSKHVEVELEYTISINGTLRAILVWDGTDWWDENTAVSGIIKWRHLIP